MSDSYRLGIARNKLRFLRTPSFSSMNNGPTAKRFHDFLIDDHLPLGLSVSWKPVTSHTITKFGGKS